MNQNIEFYNQHAAELVKQYDKVQFEQIHSDWLTLLPVHGRILDVGAGSGRDAVYMAKRGLNVIAVEPAEQMFKLAKQEFASLPITWICDSLPELSSTTRLNYRYELILLSAVWMHLDTSTRAEALDKLLSMLAPNGKLIITLRHGNSLDQRLMHEVSFEEIQQLLVNSAYHCRLLNSSAADALGRLEVSWQTVLVEKSLNAPG